MTGKESLLAYLNYKYTKSVFGDLFRMTSLGQTSTGHARSKYCTIRQYMGVTLPYTVPPCSCMTVADRTYPSRQIPVHGQYPYISNLAQCISNLAQYMNNLARQC